MKQCRNILTGILGAAVVLSLAGCGTDTSAGEPEETEAAEAAETANTETADTKTAEITTNLSKIDASAWQYNEEDDVYYQIGISYCETPADENYETLAVFVPGEYMNAADNGDGTYTCEINTEAEVNGYTAETAPIVMPINTPGYSAQSALSEYTSVTEYTDAGFVYVHAGCRGRDAGAPAGVTDLKAAVRYVRYSDDTVPGDARNPSSPSVCPVAVHSPQSWGPPETVNYMNRILPQSARYRA